MKKVSFKLAVNAFIFLVLLLSGFPSFLQAQSESPLPDVQLKFGKGLRIVAADSSMSLKLGFRFQSLFTNERSLMPDAGGESDFLIRRSRLKFDGWAVNPNLVYKIELALSNRDLKSSNDFEETSEAPKIILDAAIKWKFHRNFTLWVGQAKLPGNRERVVSSQKLQFVDRSLVNSVFNIDREMGVQLRSKFNIGRIVFKPMGSFSFGEGRNTTIANVGGSHTVGRVEVLPLGEFTGKGDYFEGDLKREQQAKIAFGASYSFNKGAVKQKPTGRFLIDADGNYIQHNLETFFLDMIFKYQGFSIMAEFANKRVVDTPLAEMDFSYRNSLIDANGRSYYTGQGLTTSLSYLFKNNWEVASRYTQVMPDTEVSFSGIREYTLGLSKYIVGHSLKVQTDVSIIDRESDEYNELRFRLQTEFAF